MEFDDYATKYSQIVMSRDDGVLELRFHTDNGSLRWSGNAHSEFAEAFADIARDPENRIVIMSGTGDTFSGPPAFTQPSPRGDVAHWDVIVRNGMQLTMSLLSIEALVISCINGPAYRHAELPLLADIVLAADDVVIQDSGHYVNRRTPGDGVNVIMPLLMGYNRGRYFLLTGQELSAQQALELGLVSEIMPREALLGRARELARQLDRQDPLALRYTRRLFTHPLKKAMHELLGYGLALEGLAAVHDSAARPDG